MEGYPDNNPKTVEGLKKAPLHLVPPSAIYEEAKAFALGAKKYGPYNWREKRISSSVYYAAALRHLTAWWEGEDVDPESGASHLGHARACMALAIDAKKYGMLNDDRPARPTLLNPEGEPYEVHGAPFVPGDILVRR